MNIAFRSSGGRGEYELAGRQGDLQVHDLYGMAMWIEILPGVAINAHSHCVLSDGKPRIRLTQNGRNAHPALLIAAALMLPKPRRERHRTEGANLLRREQFVVQAVRINVLPRADGVLICPQTLRLENSNNNRIDINFAERMGRVLRVWTAAAAQDDNVSVAVRAHAQAFTSATSTLSDLARGFSGLESALGRPDDDILPLLETHFSIYGDMIIAESEGLGRIGDEEFEENVHIDPAEARVERVRQWRLAAVRGSSSSTFRNNVRNAYDSRCMFSGQRLPRTEATYTVGVDAAHILPWSRYDLDATINGICLSKQCHWAFDEGLFHLSFDESVNSYVLTIPNRVRHAASRALFDIESFDSMVGPIPMERLPVDESIWPSRHYLLELNNFLDSELV